MKKYNNVWLWIVLVLVSDRVSKFWVMNYGWWQLNKGGVFGVVPGNWWLVLVPILIGVLIFELRKASGQNKLILAVMITAGFSNLIDRMLFGGVVDFIVYPVFGFVGNVADIWLTLGVIILIAKSLDREFRIQK